MKMPIIAALRFKLDTAKLKAPTVYFELADK